MTAAETRTLLAGASALGVALTREGVSRLSSFVDLLDVWNRRLRLTGTRSRAEIVGRHVVDSLAPVPHLPSRGQVVDLGSGAGFPGIISACVLPDLPLTLVESRRRPASFLREAIRVIPLESVQVLETRAEEASGHGLGRAAAAVLARALRLDVFLALAEPLLDRDGVAIAMQTPRTARDAGVTADAAGLRLVASHEYSFPGGGHRVLTFFSRPSKIAVS